MSKITKRDTSYSNDYITLENARKLIIEVSNINRQAPNIGIFDEPVRCFKVNEEWWSVISGMVHLLADASAWIDAENEDYYATKEILRFMQGVECVACEDIADCIETDENVQTALLQNLQSGGYSPSGNGGNSTNITLSPSLRADNLLPDNYTCSDLQMMATARKVIAELNEAVIDFWQAVELVTNPIEAANIATDGIPVAGTINNLTEFLDWLINTMQEQYVAAYNQEVEDELACALFCVMRSSCELTYDMLIQVLSEFAEGDFTLPANTTDFQALVDWALEISLTVSIGTVAAMMYLLVLAMQFGSGTVFQLAGLTSLRSIIAMTIGWNDTSYEDCDCVEALATDYWYIMYDFNVSQAGWKVSAGTQGFYRNNGFEAVDAGTIGQIVLNSPDLGAIFSIAKFRSIGLRRGSIGNGQDDERSWYSTTLIDGGGVATQIHINNFIDCNTNNCMYESGIYPTNTKNARYLTFIEQSSQGGLPVNYPPGLRLTQLEIWGYAGAGDTKPTGSVWIDELPA